jgi:hypothetical protein
MANSYTHMTARETISCSEEDFERLKEEIEIARIRADEEGTNGSDLEVSLYEGQLHAFTDYGAFDAEEIGECVLKQLGLIISKAGKTFWLWDYANSSDKLRPGSHGGGSLRIMADGSLEWPTVVWAGPSRHFIVSGRIPGDDEDTTMYVTVSKEQKSTLHAVFDAYIRKLYHLVGQASELPETVLDSEGYVISDELTGDPWAIITSVIEILGEPAFWHFEQ